MAQTLPPSPDPSSPLPRYERKRGSSAQAPRPRFQAADAVLTVLFCAAFLAVSRLAHNGHSREILAAAFAALTAGMTYLLGWRCGGRTCGIVAGSLTAFSLSFTEASVHSATALLMVLVIAALFAFACDAMVIACALAGFAAATRPDGALPGLLLLALVGVRSRRLLLPSVGVFLVAVLAGGSLRVFFLHALFPAPQFDVSAQAVSWLLQPAQLLTVWLLIPLCAELTDPARRVRWLPTALWGVLYLPLTLFVHFGGINDAMLPLMPVVFVLAAGGLARLMPLLAGEIPAARYGLATLAIVGTLGLRAHTEWAQPSPPLHPAAAAIAPAVPPLPAASAPVTVSPPAAPPIAVRVPARPVSPIKHNAPSSVRGALVGRTLVKKPAPKPAVPLYALRNGRLVRRSKWAIQWNLTHPKTQQ